MDNFICREGLMVVDGAAHYTEENSITFRVVQERWFHKVIDWWMSRKKLMKVAVIRMDFPLMIDEKSLKYHIGKNSNKLYQED